MSQPSAQDEMRAYDQLPAELRRALGAAGDQFSASQMLKALRARRFTSAQLIAMIEEQDSTANRPAAAPGRVSTGRD